MMTIDNPTWGTKHPTSAWELAGAAYRLLRMHRRAAVDIATVPTLIAVASTIAFSWLAGGNVYWDSPGEQDLTPNSAFWMMVYGVSYLWISGLMFERWTRYLLGTSKPVRAEQPTFWPSYLLAYLALGVVFVLSFTVSAVVLAPTRSVLLTVGISMSLAWVVSNLAAARLLLKSSFRAGSLGIRPGLLEVMRENWARCGLAYAIAPLPVLLGGMVLHQIAVAMGGWVAVPVFLIEPLSGSISTLLIAGIGTASIQAALPLVSWPQPALPPPTP